MLIQLLTPIFFAIFPVLASTCTVYDDVMLSELVLPLGLSIAAAVIIFVFFWIFTNNRTKAAVVSTVTASGFWFFSGVESLAEQAGKFLHLPVDPAAVGAIYLLLWLLIVVSLLTLPRPLEPFLRPLFLGGCIITLLTSGSLLVHELSVPQISNDVFPPLTPPKKLASTPNIYYIVMDACAAPSVWNSMYAPNDRDFENYLRSKGFHVYENARSNYDRTSLSFCSFLNQAYLDPVAAKMEASSEDVTVLHRLASRSRVFDYMRKAGYSVINVRSTYGPTYSVPDATNIGFVFGNRLLVALLQTSVLDAFEQHTHWIRSLLLEGRENVFNFVTMVDHMKSPKFVFEHSLLTHPPFLRQADGSPNEYANAGMSENYTSQKYTAQVRYAQRKLEALIDHLLSEKDKPVIILQSDHGPSMSTPHNSPRYYNERMHILCAVYFPDQNYQEMPAKLSAINLFRCVAHHVFGDTTPLSPNKSYVAPDNSPFQFLDVTDDLTSVENETRPAGAPAQKGAAQ